MMELIYRNTSDNNSLTKEQLIEKLGRMKDSKEEAVTVQRESEESSRKRYVASQSALRKANQRKRSFKD